MVGWAARLISIASLFFLFFGRAVGWIWLELGLWAGFFVGFGVAVHWLTAARPARQKDTLGMEADSSQASRAKG